MIVEELGITWYLILGVGILIIYAITCIVFLKKKPKESPLSDGVNDQYLD